MNEQDGNANAGGQVAVAFDTTQITSAANYSQPKPGDPCHPLAAGAHPPAVAFEPRFARNDRGGPDEIASPLKAESGRTGKGDGAPCVATAAAVRRLTPRECERLQGFPDDYTLIPYRNKPAADGPRYKALGNSMAVPVMAWLGRRIDYVEAVVERAGAAA
jgi:DNA (cytosine-5)-methyltransferase 1